MKVSVALVTYNHEKFIKEAVESILKQEVEFDYEIVIGEDCSSDKTRGIVIDYKKKYPERIKLLLHKNNIGMNKNFTETVDACRGEYIAYLEGDDYWTSKNKLQKQVDLLESNIDYKFSYHLVKKIDQEKNQEIAIMPDFDLRGDLTINDLLIRNFIGTCSVVFRNGIIKNWPGWIYDLKMMDWPLYVLLLENGGKAGYADDIMGVYRIHNKSYHSQNSNIINYINAIEALKKFKIHFKKNHYPLINFGLFRFRYYLAKEYTKNKKIFSLLFLFPALTKYLILVYFVKFFKKEKTI